MPARVADPATIAHAAPEGGLRAIHGDRFLEPPRARASASRTFAIAARDTGVGCAMHATIASMLRGHKVIVAILVSAREHADTAIEELVARVSNAGGEVVGRVVQRRGVSRSKKPGGARRMSAPMARDTYIGHGKAKELAAMCAAKQASVVVFANELDDRQRETLGALTGVKVIDGREL